MSTVPHQPGLTPRFCFNQTALRDFLRLSRSATDDSIAQNLNNLVAPGTSTVFSPASTSSRLPRPDAQRGIESAACSAFKDRVLFPAWQSRSDVLSYCASVATSEDPSDPNLIVRQQEDARARKRVVNERLDPYSGRYFPREARTEVLAALLRNENMVENIVRARTWRVIGERCDNGGHEWEDALDSWNRHMNGNRP
ncbi:Hypothetical protein R9X50_00272600 [Acrodontium crateriforme]|uniref:Caffeine-induced death protein Cid2 n=1 Tax=Acrodontium crateriforme TaxID=150365 RepID=A0AAQ3M4U2_9PEZI|nr:Hypothetical protein R9X50_00272600 [Acrodontium crateriforme]